MNTVAMQSQGVCCWTATDVQLKISQSAVGQRFNCSLSAVSARASCSWRCSWNVGRCSRTLPCQYIPGHTIPYYTTTYLAIPYHTSAYHCRRGVPCHTMLHHSITAHTKPYYSMPYHTWIYNNLSNHLNPSHYSVPLETLQCNGEHTTYGLWNCC